MEVLVSILLPIYNGEKTLERTLKSLEKQTYPNIELLACIDGTKDGSLEILEEYAGRNKNTRILINEKNLGYGPTMNRLVFESKGEFCAIAEQDDVYPEDRINTQVEVLIENPKVGLVSGIVEHINYDKNPPKIISAMPGVLVNGKQYPKDSKEMFLLNYIKQTKVVMSAMMFRKKVHIENGLYFSTHFGTIGVDWSYFLRFALRSEILGLNKTLVYMDRTPARGNVTSQSARRFRFGREILRSFRFEEPSVVTKEVYREALKFHRDLELGHKTGIKFLFYSFAYTLIYLDVSFLRRLIDKIKRRLNQ